MIMTKPTLPHLREKKNRPTSFTLVELLAVITIIGILAGLTLGAAGAVRRHGSSSRAKSEIAALQAACERYFADNNLYPSTNSMPNPSSSSDVNPSSTSYITAGRSLFSSLHGVNQYNRPSSTRRYFEAKPAMVSSSTASDPYYVDPWGYAYGYNSDGTNAPLIWSTAGQTSGGGNTNKWIASWPKM
jgi:prepilin-type N-terminal cleavage/methylation domain-containing protein